MTPFVRCRPALGTLLQVAVRDPLPHAELLAATEAAFAAVGQVDRAMSFHRNDSDLSRLNAAPAGAVLALDGGLVEVLRLARELHAISEGVFDPGVAERLVDWGVLPPRRPAQGASIVDVQLLDATRVRVLRATCLDLGGIAKGHAVDRAIAALRDAGVTQADVECGGDLRVLGAPRPVHLRVASGPARLRLVGELGDGAIATSSPGAHAGHADGRCPSAFVDPRSRTRVADPRSFSVLASTCAVADALTKVLAISGRLPAAATRWNAQALVL